MNIQKIDDKTVIIDGKYILYSNGKMVSKRTNGKWVECKPRKHTNGYMRYTMNYKDVYIHRIVAMCFIDNPNNYNEVSHEDNDKTNNDVSNLKWCDRKYNNKKMFIDGIRTKEEMSIIAKMPKFKARIGKSKKNA